MRRSSQQHQGGICFAIECVKLQFGITGSGLPKRLQSEQLGGTYIAKQCLPTVLPPSATLLRIANIVGMEFELQQVICGIFDSYLLVDPSPVVRIRLVICAYIPARRLERGMLSPRLMLAHREFTDSFLTR